MISPAQLSGIPIFDCLDDALRRRYAERAADWQLSDGEWLLREGEQAHFFVVLEGELVLSKEVLARRQDYHTYKRGDFFGELPILLGTPTMVAIRANGRARVARFDRQDLHELIRESAACSALILQVMNFRLQTVRDRLLELPSARVLVVGSRYDTDCRDIRNFLSMNRIPYEWIDREQEPDRIPSCMPRELQGPVVVIDKTNCLGEAPTVRRVAEELGFQTSPKNENYDVVVVGAGPAGLAASVYGSSEGLRVLLVERAAPGGQAGTSSRIENYLGFPSGISGEELTDRAIKQAQHFGAEIVLTREVENIEPLSDGRYCVELDGGDRVSTRAVILATGVDWRRLEAEGVERLSGRGVLYGAARTEASTVIGKDIFIVGGGNSAGQAAMYFSAYANSVTLLVRGEGLHLTMSQYLIGQLATRSNVQVETHTLVEAVGGEDHLETISTRAADGEVVTREAHALFVMIGANANTRWLPKDLQRDERGYICTGRDVSDLPNWSGSRVPFLLETNLPGIFCAGDVRHDSIKRVSSGVGEGSMAIAFVHQYLALEESQRRASIEAQEALPSR
ncbi:MAG: FAD-dependent oxidoreductase [Acidobacteriaceae bacterium]|nr:FAD-dependent oxidoreductase [Acidobacteriaceae bacterium]